MRVVELDASLWRTMLDFHHALRAAVGAPDWHGSSVDAFLDSMIYHDDINALKAPYTIRISNTATLCDALRSEVEHLAAAINRHGAADRGTDLEVTVQISS